MINNGLIDALSLVKPFPLPCGNIVKDSKMTDQLEKEIRITALKKAALVMNALAEQIKDEANKSETKSLAWTISWAVKELERKTCPDAK